MPPVSGGVDPDLLSAVTLDDVYSPLVREFAVWVEGHPGPESAIQHGSHGVLLNMVDQDPARVDPGILERIDDQQGALEFVLEVGRVNKDQAIEPLRNLDLFLQDLEFVAGVFVEPDLTDSEHV